MRKYIIGLFACTTFLASCQNADQNEASSVNDTEAVNPDAEARFNEEDKAVMQDPYLWLEEVEGDKALDWVKRQNTRSLGVLQARPDFEQLYTEALDIVNDEERIPSISYRDGYAYNFWQDETNIRGLWRRTSLESYKTDAPEWEVLLDFDALSEAEEANWVYKGVSCLKGSSRCILSLSDGGKDAVIRREFDTDTKSFVEGGFNLPESKGGSVWEDEDTLLVAIDWGEGSLTRSGYPFVVKRLKRGQALDEAVEVMRGQEEDVGVFPGRIDSADGHVVILFEADSFFSTTHWVVDTDQLHKLPLPPRSSVTDFHKGQILVTLQQDWQSANGQDLAQGALISFPLGLAIENRDVKYEVIYAPDVRSSIESVAATQSHVLVSVYENVIGGLYAFSRGAEGWTKEKIALPDKGAISIRSANADSDIAFVMHESFIAPDTLWMIDLAAKNNMPVKALSEKFNAEGIRVEQHMSTSSDGTKIPYFLVLPANAKSGEPLPTLLYGYGGFQISETPFYSASIGKLWLERGGAFALANIRGGGEFGPAWHQAGLKTKRQIIYDDFISIAEDLIDRKVSSPDKLGIMGGSNGGLLMGVMLTQRPELWKAVVIQVPLLDMLRYHKLLAGASWVDEYGSPDIPEERSFLESISPYHNFDAEADYPAPLFVTSTKDDRVHPAHARKMAKLFEDAGKPFYYYENIDGGHSAAANQQEVAKRRALEYTYLSAQLMDAD